MNIAKLEAEFLENPNPSRTALKRIANANGMDLSEVERWFELKRLEGQEVQDLVPDHNVPGPSEARRSVRRAREGSDDQDQDQLPIKRPAIVDPAIQKMNEKLDLYLHSPKNQDFFLGLMKILGPQASEAEINSAGQMIGVDPKVILYWKQKLETKGLLPIPVPSIQPPTINRSQLPTHQPRIQGEGVFWLATPRQLERERRHREFRERMRARLEAERRRTDFRTRLENDHVELQRRLEENNRIHRRMLERIRIRLEENRERL